MRHVLFRVALLQVPLTALADSAAEVSQAERLDELEKRFQIDF